jgi:hypothetical protein
MYHRTDRLLPPRSCRGLPKAPAPQIHEFEPMNSRKSLLVASTTNIESTRAASCVINGPVSCGEDVVSRVGYKSGSVLSPDVQSYAKHHGAVVSVSQSSTPMPFFPSYMHCNCSCNPISWIKFDSALPPLPPHSRLVPRRSGICRFHPRLKLAQPKTLRTCTVALCPRPRSKRCPLRALNMACRSPSRCAKPWRDLSRSRDLSSR